MLRFTSVVLEEARRLQRQVGGLVQVRFARLCWIASFESRGNFGEASAGMEAPTLPPLPRTHLSTHPLQRREEQDDELAGLRARLADEFDAGATSGSRQAQEQGSALAAQLAEARQRCVEFAEEAEGLRAEGARLAGARDGAEAALAAAQAELGEAKALLVAQEQQQPGAVGGRGGAAEAAEAAARLAELEAENRQLAGQLEALQAGVGRHQQAAAGVGSQLDEVQQVGGWVGRGGDKWV